MDGLQYERSRRVHSAAISGPRGHSSPDIGPNFTLRPHGFARAASDSLSSAAAFVKGADSNTYGTKRHSAAGTPIDSVDQSLTAREGRPEAPPSFLAVYAIVFMRPLRRYGRMYI